MYGGRFQKQILKMYTDFRKLTRGLWKIREFKKLLRRRQGLRRLKSKFIFTYESRDTLKSFTFFFITAKTITKLNLRHGDKFEKEF